MSPADGTRPKPERKLRYSDEVRAWQWNMLWLMLLPLIYILCLPLFPYLVHISAAWNKPARNRWRRFCVSSVIAALVGGIGFGFLPARENFLMAYLRLIVIAGLLLLPLAVYSTIDTYRSRKIQRQRPTG